MEYQKVESYPDLVKDPTNNAILNTNLGSLMEYKKKKELHSTLDTLKTEVDSVKEELVCIKTYLAEIINRLNVDNK